jgi:hypothetical protein
MNTPYIHAFKGFSLGLLCLALSACEMAPTQVDQQFGMAVRQAQTQQTLNPTLMNCMQTERGAACPMHAQHHQPGGMHERHQAGSSTDGVAAQSAIERYQESFQTPPAPTPVFNIGLGTTRSR